MLQTVWGWQPALYLFLGGMGAGAFLMAAVLYLIAPKSHARTICASMWASVACLCIGLLLLVIELINPLRGLMFWQSFSHFTSWMTIGAWGLFVAVIVFGLSAILATLAVMEPLEGLNRSSFRKGLAVAGIALGAFVAVYTGLLLMSAQGVPFWNTIALPFLFTVSAFSTGVALVEIISLVCARKEEVGYATRSLMERIAVALVFFEIVAVAIFLFVNLGSDVSTAAGATAVASASLLAAGRLSICFWGLVVGVGLCLPLATAIIVLARKKGAGAFIAVGAAGTLIGGCELRFLVVAAGQHADVVGMAFQSLGM